MRTGCNLAESSEKGSGSKRAVLLVMVVIYLINVRLFQCSIKHRAMKTSWEVELNSISISLTIDESEWVASLLDLFIRGKTHTIKWIRGYRGIRVYREG
jgi:hypothetical protein